MRDASKTKQQLIDELVQLRKRFEELERAREYYRTLIEKNLDELDDKFRPRLVERLERVKQGERDLYF